METQFTANNAEKRRRSAAEKAAKEAWEKISRSNEEVPIPGSAEPEISPEFVSQTKEHLADLKGQLEKRVADLEGTKNKSVIEKLKEEIRELETFVQRHSKNEVGEESIDIDVSEFAEPQTTETRSKERKPTINAINSQIENLDQKLKETVSRRLEAIRATDSAALKAVQKEILQRRDELTKLRAEREALREENKTFVKERMRGALAHYESSKKERARHQKLSETGLTLKELKEREMNKKDMVRWNKLLSLDAETNRSSEDYKRLKTEYETLEPEAVAGFMDSLRAEAQTGNLDLEHAAEQIVADIEAGKIAGFTEAETKFFTASAEEVSERAEAIKAMGEGMPAEEAVTEWQKIKKQSAKKGGAEEAEEKFFAASKKEAHERVEAIETMGPEMTVEEAVTEWEKIKQRSTKGEKESRKEEEAFIDFLHEKYPDYVDFTGKEYSDAKAKPQKIGFFKKLFSFGKPKTRLEEMEESLENVPNVGKLAGKFLIGRLNRAKKEQRPISVKSR